MRRHRSPACAPGTGVAARAVVIVRASVLVLLAGFLAVGTADAGVASDVKQAGHELDAAAHQAGHDIRRAGKQTVRGVKRGGKTVGHTAKQGAHAAKEGVKEFGHSVKGER
jgi:hypothetical protein